MSNLRLIFHFVQKCLNFLHVTFSLVLRHRSVYSAGLCLLFEKNYLGQNVESKKVKQKRGKTGALEQKLLSNVR